MESITDNRQILNAYADAGFKMIRLRADDKKPRDNGWQREENRISLKDAAAWVADGGGIGVQGGEASAWVCAVDLDSAEAKKLAPRFLRDTLTIGKENDELPGAYVYISEGADYRKIKDVDPDPERGEVLSVKASKDGKGHQFVVPPSMHPSKGRYMWGADFDPSSIARVSADELDMHVSRLGAAALIAHNLPRRGRHDYAMAVAGLLLRNGEDLETVRALMRPAWDLASAPQDGLRDLEAIIEDTYERLEAGEPITGGGKLNDLVPRLAQKIGTALRWAKPRGVVQKKYARTDIGNAERLVDTFGEHIRYCYPWKSWLVWDGKRWKRDDSGKIVRRAKNVARSIHEEAARELDPDEQKAINKWAIASQSEQRINSMISLARAEVSVAPADLDSDPMLLAVENGTVDLRTGEIRASRPEDLITKLAPVEYDPDARAPRFERFLEEIFPGDPELQAFVLRFAGYTLTGSTTERCMAILWGGGRNGKSTLVELLRDVMGDYARVTAAETLLQKRSSGGASNEIAALAGARFVSAAEVEKNRRLAESKVKELTGSDTITARFLFAELFDFKPEFKLWLSTNNKPEITGTDDAIWDRIRLIPFEVRFEGDSVDHDLPRKLREESAGVLAWMVRGCLDWQANGLAAPAAVRNATEEYRTEMDAFAEFLEDRCVTGPGKSATAEALYIEYQRWCLTSGEQDLGSRKFGQTLRGRGFKSGLVSKGPDRGKRRWEGVGLRSHEPDPGGEALQSSTRRGSSGEALHAEPRIDKPNTANRVEHVEDVEAKSESFAMKIPRVGEDSEKALQALHALHTDFSSDAKVRRERRPESGPPAR